MYAKHTHQLVCSLLQLAHLPLFRSHMSPQHRAVAEGDADQLGDAHVGEQHELRNHLVSFPLLCKQQGEFIGLLMGMKL